MMLKKSQVTAFVILGIVILISVAMFVYVNAQTQTSALKTQAAKATLEKVDSNLVIEYVTSCLRKTSQDAVLRSFSQGGALYLDGGEVNITNHPQDMFLYDLNGLQSIVYSTVKKSNLLGTDLRYPLPPAYPKLNAPPLPIKPFPYSKKNIFLLCDPLGVNRLGTPGQGYAIPCASVVGYNLYGANSLQKQLEDYTNIKLKECINKTMLQDITVFTLSIGEPNVTFFLGDGETLVAANYPMQLLVDENVIKEDHFEIVLPIRLKKLYDLINYMVTEDSNSLDFDYLKESDRRKFKDYDKDFRTTITIDKICPKCTTGNYTDVVRVTDKASLIDGYPITFQFAVENRIPALDYLHRNVAQKYKDMFPDVDYVFLQGSEISLMPRGFDPDDNDKLIFVYNGWKADYDEEFDPRGCCEGFPPTPPGPWKYGTPVDCKSHDIVSCQTRGSATTNNENWAATSKTALAVAQVPNNNQDYRAIDLVDTKTDYTSGTKVYAFTKDIGYHKVQVKVLDEEGLADWQEVNILVYDDINPKITLIERYQWIPILPSPHILSIEDPYTFSGIDSVSFFGAGAESYKWTINNVDYTQTDSEFDVPEDKDAIQNNININNIKTENIFGGTGSKEVKLKVGAPDVTGTMVYSTQEDVITMNVVACVLGDTTASAKKPYPYDDFNKNSLTFENNNLDPYNTKHICCTNTNTYELSSKNCFTSTSYGAYNSFNEELFYSVSESNPSWVANKPTLFTDNRINDIFVRKYNVNCSGVRGNTCDGAKSQIITVHTLCPDQDTIKGETARCQGPSGTFVQESLTVPTSSNSCQNYDYPNTFERTTTFCNSNTKCIDPSSNNYYSSLGKFSCKAGCDVGVCKKPVDCKFFSGDSCGINSNCDEITYGSFSSLTPYIRVLTPTDSKDGVCNIAGQFYDYRTTEEGCNVRPLSSSADSGGIVKAHYAFGEGSTSQFCCGDDINEFPRQVGSKYICCNLGSDTVTSSYTSSMYCTPHP